MIKVKFYKDSSGTYKGFQIMGHAGFAESGHDIVCAAVSALYINTLNSIETFTNDAFVLEEDTTKNGYKFKFKSKNVSSDSILLLDSLQLGLKGIEEDNSDYISVMTEEV